jgi:hypothetical protein
MGLSPPTELGRMPVRPSPLAFGLIADNVLGKSPFGGVSNIGIALFSIVLFSKESLLYTVDSEVRRGNYHHCHTYTAMLPPQYLCPSSFPLAAVHIKPEPEFVNVQEAQESIPGSLNLYKFGL